MLSRIAFRSSSFALAVALFSAAGDLAEAQVTYVGSFSVQNYGTGMYMTDALSYNSSGDVQDLWRDLSDQVYSFYQLPNGSFAIINDFNNLALTDTGFEGGSIVEQWGFGDNIYQQWYVLPAVNGSFVIYNLGSGNVLDDPTYDDFGMLTTSPFTYSVFQLWFL